MNFSVEWDTQAFDQAVAALPTALDVRLLSACRDTALALQREMKSRLSRQLSAQATGATVAGILAELSYDKHAYVVRTEDALSETERAGRQVWNPASNPSAWLRRSTATFRQAPHVGLYLEKGTKPGKRRNYARTAPRPFFYASVALEAPSHERRVIAAIDETGREMGWGG